MVKPIMKDPIFLAQKAEDAGTADGQTALDLLDTLRAHADGCVGMAANMIGVNKRIIAFVDGKRERVMLNPQIMEKSDPYEAREGCLSLSGVRKTVRYRKIRVQYQTQEGNVRTERFAGWTAQIIQHEVDHLSGVLI